MRLLLLLFSVIDKLIIHPYLVTWSTEKIIKYIDEEQNKIFKIISFTRSIISVNKPGLWSREPGHILRSWEKKFEESGSEEKNLRNRELEEKKN